MKKQDFAGRIYIVFYLRDRRLKTHTHINQNNHTDSDFNPSTPMSDKERTSPYNISTISSRKVMRIKRKIT